MILYGAERVETVVGQACQCIGLHSNCLQLPRDACFDGAERVETVVWSGLSRVGLHSN